MIATLLVLLARVLSAAPPSVSRGPATEQDLQRPVHYQFAQTALREALGNLADQLRVNLVVDEKALHEAHVPGDASLTGRGKREPLEQALATLLGPLHLDVLVRDEVLWVTTAEALERHLENRVYKVTVPIDDWDAFQKKIETQIAPQSWDTVGGPAAVAVWPAGAIAVWQTQANHQALLAASGPVLRPLPAVDPAGGKRPRHARPNGLEFLGQPINVEFVRQPLRDALAALAGQSKTKIRLEEKALEEAEIAPSVPCTLAVRGIRLESALTLLLEPLGLGWAPDHGSLCVTTPGEIQEKHLGEITYDVSDLVQQADGQALSDLITATLDPASWNTGSGSGSVMLATRTQMRVRQTYQAHRALERLLAELRQAGRR